jgi:2-O-(6-phospho-alpha-D-mannosyl)-D-glycerate hydrolase
MTNKFDEIHVVCNTHWDREFRFPFQRTRMMLVKMMDYLITLLEKNPGYKSYTLDAHAIMVEDYLAARPEMRDRITKLVKERRIFMGPWYTLPDIPNIGQESVARNLLYGHKVSSEFGHTMKVGYTPCSWGQTGQLPQIYSLFGIDTILFYRGISPHECSSEFIWESPDGTKALAHRFALFARYNYYYLVFRKITYGLDINERSWTWGEDGETPYKSADADADYSTIEILEPDVLYKKENLKPALESMLEIEGDQYAGKHFLAMHGHDISWPHPLASDVIKDADKVFPDTRVIHSDLEQYFDTLKKNLDFEKLPVLKGERRCNLKDGYWTYLLPGTISARTSLKQENFRTETMLVHQAEPASCISWLLGGKKYPERYIDMAWRNLLCTHTHDANAGCAPDNVTDDVRYHLRQSRQLSEELVQDSLKCLAMNVDTAKFSDNDQFLIVFNPLAFQRSDIVEVLVDIPDKNGAESLIIRDPDGNICDYQLIETTNNGLFVDNQWNVPQAWITKRFRIKLLVNNIPALGYKVFTIEENKKPDRKNDSLFSSENCMENEFLKVQAESDGTITLTDKITGIIYRKLLTLEDCGEVGNAWKHESPFHDRIVYSTKAHRIQKVEDGPLSATLRIDVVLNVPENCPDSSRRSDEYVDINCSHFITLNKNSRKLDLKIRFDNTARDHRLRMLFPTGFLGAETSSADSHFDVVERPIDLPDCHDWKEPAVGTFPYRTFVDVSHEGKGLAVLSEGLQEFEILRNENRTIAITLLRSLRILLEVSEQRKQELPDPGPQCPGIHEFRMSIYPHRGDWSESLCIKEAISISVPLRAAQFGKNKSGRLPLESGLLKISNDLLEISAVKKAEDNNGLIIRIYNPTFYEQDTTIIFAKRITGLWDVNMNEEKTGERSYSGNEFKIRVGAKKIMTFLIRLT